MRHTVCQLNPVCTHSHSPEKSSDQVDEEKKQWLDHEDVGDLSQIKHAKC